MWFVSKKDKYTGLETKINDTVEGVINRVIDNVEEEVKKLYRLIDATSELERLTEQNSKLKIEKSQIEEGFARERREIEHKLGLEKTRQAQDLALGLREQKVKLEEENLKNNKILFETQMKFTTDRFVAENEYVRDILKQIMDRLPTQHTEVNIKKTS